MCIVCNRGNCQRQSHQNTVSGYNASMRGSLGFLSPPCITAKSQVDVLRKLQQRPQLDAGFSVQCNKRSLFVDVWQHNFHPCPGMVRGPHFGGTQREDLRVLRGAVPWRHLHHPHDAPLSLLHHQPHLPVPPHLRRVLPRLLPPRRVRREGEPGDHYPPRPRGLLADCGRDAASHPGCYTSFRSVDFLLKGWVEFPAWKVLCEAHCAGFPCTCAQQFWTFWKPFQDAKSKTRGQKRHCVLRLFCQMQHRILNATQQKLLTCYVLREENVPVQFPICFALFSLPTLWVDELGRRMQNLSLILWSGVFLTLPCGRHLQPTFLATHQGASKVRVSTASNAPEWTHVQTRFQSSKRLVGNFKYQGAKNAVHPQGAIFSSSLPFVWMSPHMWTFCGKGIMSQKDESGVFSGS